MAALDGLREHLDHVVAHEGYRDGEKPVYRECRHGCGGYVRADRTDLIREHDAVCPFRRVGTAPGEDGPPGL